jgi:hypothetical protein
MEEDLERGPQITLGQPASPVAQTVRRKLMDSGVRSNAEPAPLQRLDMHRPERHQRFRPHHAPAPGPRDSAFLDALRPHKIGFIERFPPAPERLRRKPMLRAIGPLTHSALAPGFDMNRPESSMRLVRKPGPLRHRATSQKSIRGVENPRKGSREQPCNTRTLTEELASSAEEGIEDEIKALPTFIVDAVACTSEKCRQHAPDCQHRPPNHPDFLHFSVYVLLTACVSRNPAERRVSSLRYITERAQVS